MTEEVKPEAKKVWKSKTFWVAIISALAPLVPEIQEWISANPEAYAAFLGLIFAALRSITHGRIEIL